MSIIPPRHLGEHDKELHQKAEAQINDCFEMNKSVNPAFKSLTQDTKTRLRATVGEMYWKEAHDYLDMRMAKSAERTQKNASLVPVSKVQTTESVETANALLSLHQGATVKNTTRKPALTIQTIESVEMAKALMSLHQGS
jgi:hypothetical protein